MTEPSRDATQTPHPTSRRTSGYRDRLAAALRLEGLDGPEIGAVLEEVDSHLRDSGEDPVAAFGEPDVYAADVVRARTGTRAGARPGLPDGVAIGISLVAGAVALEAVDGLLGGGVATVTLRELVVVALLVVVAGAVVWPLVTRYAVGRTGLVGPVAAVVLLPLAVTLLSRLLPEVTLVTVRGRGVLVALALIGVVVFLGPPLLRRQQAITRPGR